MDVHRISVDVHHLLYGRTTFHKWMSISFSIDVRYDIYGRPPVSIWTYHVWPWTSTTYDIDVQNYINGCPSVSVRTFNMQQSNPTSFFTDVQHDVQRVAQDVHQFLMDVQRQAVIYQLLYGRTTLYTWTFINFYMDVQCVGVDIHQLLYGRSKLYKWTSSSFSEDVHHVYQFLYGRTTCGRGRLLYGRTT